MGDRALVIFFGASDALSAKKVHVEVSPTAYLHVHGSEVPELLKEHKQLMSSRTNDASYALARFIGVVHSDMPDSNLSLGCFETSSYVKTAIKHLVAGKDTPVKAPVWDREKRKDILEPMHPADAIAAYSHGDAGVIVVDCRDMTWKAYGGYLTEEETKEVA